jgi:hypothetical protein
LNFGAFGSFSPLKMRSAPTFFPSLGQPLFGPKRLCNMPQEGSAVTRMARKRTFMVLGVFNGLADIKISVNKPTTIIQYFQ